MKKIIGLYYKTGEFAELVGLNKRTLHYYDEIGIFRPSYVGENGYRYYSVNQMDQLALIVTLRDLGVSLKDIRTCLDSSDVEQLNHLLEEQDREIDRMILQLQQRKRLLQNTLDSNRAFQTYLGRGYQLRKLPEERWEVLLDIDRDRAGEGKQKRREDEFSVVNYLTDGPYTGMYLNLRSGRHLLFQKCGNGSQVIPGGTYLCAYQQIPDDMNQIERVEQEAKRMHRWAEEHQIALSDCIYVEYNDILPCGVRDNRAQYIYLRCRVECEIGLA